MPKPAGKKTRGRLKIKMEYIPDKLKRYTTFSKRRSGIMKKAYELSTLTGTDVLLLVASETGHVYTYATEKLKPIFSSDIGRQLIQQCLGADASAHVAASAANQHQNQVEIHSAGDDDSDDSDEDFIIDDMHDDVGCNNESPPILSLHPAPHAAAASGGANSSVPMHQSEPPKRSRKRTGGCITDPVKDEPDSCESPTSNYPQIGASSSSSPRSHHYLSQQQQQQPLPHRNSRHLSSHIGGTSPSFIPASFSPASANATNNSRMYL